MDTDFEARQVVTPLVDPGRVDFINAGVHLQQRQERNRTTAFIQNVHLLQAADFNIFVSCVMYPPIFAVFPASWDWYAEQGIILVPKALQGRHFEQAKMGVKSLESLSHPLQSPEARRQISVRPQAQYQAKDAVCQRQETTAFKAQYALRAGVESTISQGMRLI